MTYLNQQLHGYRNGHQLLSSSLKLPKNDQELVDRLSDIAGPLRPGEHFASYLTYYPLPSGSHYIVGRTWQDLEAPRAGCVRTRSLMVPMHEWCAGVDIGGLVAMLSTLGPVRVAEPLDVPENFGHFASVKSSQVVELVEALFLEERKPIVVFDAVDSEAITIRLLSAFWPAFRGSFAASTFALSPRSIGARSFDLVFAPKDARSRFSEWPGRRIDAGKSASPRHRWSSELAERIFGGDEPSLMREDALGELSSIDGGSEANLRISLLWNELHQKLDTSPNAVLGLLDIANSRSTRNVEAIRLIEPKLGLAAKRATRMLSPSDAWRFLLALTDKLRDVRIRLSAARAIRTAAIELANQAPFDAISNVKMLSTALGHELLLGAVGDGLARSFDSERATAIAELDPSSFLKLLLLSPTFAQVSLTSYPILSVRLAIALVDAPSQTRKVAKRRLLRFLVEDWHVDAASILIATLSSDELVAQAKILGVSNGFAASALHEPLVARAQAIEAVTELRSAVAEIADDHGSDLLLLRLLAPIRADVQWLLKTSTLNHERRRALLSHILSDASDRQFESMLVGERDEVLEILLVNPIPNIDLISRLLSSGGMDANIVVDTTMRLLPQVNESQARFLAHHALEVLLPQRICAGRKVALEKLLIAMGTSLDGSWAFRIALRREIPSEIVAENLSAFNGSPKAIRQRLLSAVEDLAAAIVARQRIDYSAFSVEAAAEMLWDSGAIDPKALLRSSLVLMPFLLRSWNEPASSLIAATFPSIYQALKKANAVPDLFGVLLFLDWDRCKSARRELVDAFMRSSWPAIHIALTAARAEDLKGILRLISTHRGGESVIIEIKQNLTTIPDPWRGQVATALMELR